MRFNFDLFTTGPTRPCLKTASLKIAGLLILMSLVAGFSAPVLGAPTTLAKGTFLKKTQKISGSWSIIQSGQQRYLVLSEDFKTRKAPDLKFVLSPQAAASAESSNAMEGGVVLAPLKSAKGPGRYEIPADIDLKLFKSLLLHCEQYTKLWGAGALEGE